MYSATSSAEININADEGDRILFDVCRVLNCNVWPVLADGVEPQEMFSLQLKSLKSIFCRYNQMEIFKSYSEEDIVDSFLDIIRYASRYFNTSTVNPIEFWSKILELNQDKKQWKVSLLLVEICLCAPFSNASLERLFSHMNIVKSTTRSRLSNRSLNSILRIRISGISIRSFHDKYLQKCVDYSAKNRRLQQRKRKLYKKRENRKEKRVQFDITDFSSDSDQSDSEESD